MYFSKVRSVLPFLLWPLSSLHSHKAKAGFPCCPLAPCQGPVEQGNLHGCCVSSLPTRSYSYWNETAPALTHQIKPQPRQMIQLTLRVRAGHELFTEAKELDLVRSTKMKENLQQCVSLLKADNGETVGSCCFRCTGKKPSTCFMKWRWKRHHSQHQWVSESSKSKGAYWKCCANTHYSYTLLSL